MSGKGDTFRKLNSDQQKAFEDNFDKIFGKKKLNIVENEWDEKYCEEKKFDINVINNID